MREKRVTSMADNGPPPAAAGTLYSGKVMHQRLNPFGHRFSYSVFSLLVDIDRLDDLAELSRLLCVNRAGVLSFHERDHVEKDDETLRQFTDRLLARAGLDRPAARILLLAYPRMFGYAFNPISTYFAYDKDGRLLAIIYGVRNTFGERHSYVAPVLAGEQSPAGIRQTRTKIFHVSPFMDMGLRYHFRILPPGKTVRVRIHETAGTEPMLAATFNADATALNDANLARYLLRFPFMTLKVMAGIHWEALKLWLKGARFRTSPPPPETASYRDTA
ncbi:MULTISPECIES: DUF1365 domain-containing protein [unclassified Rhizobium]|uniref:DUF1365 domain-containing protein n=1 Tax=unclassified Rhizobium TaxID=2613769 RepID=UPI0006F5B05D|nr:MULTISPECIES: DUF1365 domain-containing protein [unclassified Rhizobium]KQV38018.1 hypothetical protein ASC86_07155 [Rhizobium sp. Root1212]KRD30676.1 hypothetical protein ASE37_07150 [Rhizobium sp. Root268]